MSAALLRECAFVVACVGLAGFVLCAVLNEFVAEGETFDD